MAGFMKGRGAVLTLFIDGRKVDALDVETWDIEEDAEVIADNVNGEKRSRLDKVVNFYRLKLSCFNATADKLKRLLEYDEALDNDDQKQVVFGLKLRDEQGGSDRFKLGGCMIDNWKWASGGRANRSMLDVPIRGTDFKVLA
jgi:hypothetical protein